MELTTGTDTVGPGVVVAQRCPAIEIRLMWAIHHAGEWRLVVGVSVNVERQIVSVQFRHWGGVVDYPAESVVEMQGPVVFS